MKIGRLRDKGVERFIRFLDGHRAGIPQDLPKDFLSNDEFVEAIGGDSVWLDALNLDDRLSAAKGLDEIVLKLGLTSAEKDSGFWSWCSVFLFDRLCKTSGSSFKPGELPIWIAEPNNYRRYYRHYLASIWSVYAAHKSREDKLKVLLNGSVNTPGELWAQVAATETLITNPSMIDALYGIYWDEAKNERKKGSGGSSPRRLTKVLKQFDKTYDFFSMSGDEIINLLPAEFDRFKNTRQSQ